ncbi:Oidioi.mRNA.OKI2018_I69.chr1.g2533.t1.cds [Oikopleura dioica]|uniref:Oidioi.mRNA.OKI2018_I69.chr1.g2533.t1.cds n=1 Tax=Oikopleura dioica TaxID=34765 RepID=A0ABN7SVA6_OIKDI|nr:Oidioi.mRNA.OKI2018_I69.chr1.g2533.t1.cds [Oikopleura dioica]
MNFNLFAQFLIMDMMLPRYLLSPSKVQGINGPDVITRSPRNRPINPLGWVKRGDRPMNPLGWVKRSDLTLDSLQPDFMRNN